MNQLITCSVSKGPWVLHYQGILECACVCACVCVRGSLCCMWEFACAGCLPPSGCCDGYFLGRGRWHCVSLSSPGQTDFCPSRSFTLTNHPELLWQIVGKPEKKKKWWHSGRWPLIASICSQWSTTGFLDRHRCRKTGDGANNVHHADELYELSGHMREKKCTCHIWWWGTAEN